MSPKRRPKKSKPKPKLPRNRHRDAATGRLTEQQEKFIDHYAHTGLSRASAIAAGYASGSADVRAAELLHNDKVKAAIQRAIDGIEEGYRPTREKIIRALALRAFTNPTEVVRIEAGSVVITNTDDLTPAAQLLIAEVSQSVTAEGGTLRVKLVDQVATLIHLAKIEGHLRDDAVSPFLGKIDPKNPPKSAYLYMPVQLEA